jgi:hypothetical protein
MSTHTMTCFCKDCETSKNEKSFDSYHERYGVFSIAMEYMGKIGLLKYIESIVCPYCKSSNWFITDSCNR